MNSHYSEYMLFHDIKLPFTEFDMRNYVMESGLSMKPCSVNKEFCILGFWGLHYTVRRLMAKSFWSGNNIVHIMSHISVAASGIGM